MRHAKMPLWKGKLVSDEHWERNGRWIIPTETTSLTEYTRAITGAWEEGHEFVLDQARMIAEILTKMGLDEFSRAVFDPRGDWTAAS